MCRPHFIESTNSQLRVTDMRHPLVCTSVTNFVPNHLELGTDDSVQRIALVTGPNMGGKSTLLRQVCARVRSSECNIGAGSDQLISYCTRLACW
jgi:DNA mismatch repair protein MSH6